LRSFGRRFDEDPKNAKAATMRGSQKHESRAGARLLLALILQAPSSEPELIVQTARGVCQEGKPTQTGDRHSRAQDSRQEGLSHQDIE
jgi:hypothetical protein